MAVQDIINTGMNYFQQGLAFIREWISKIIGFTGLDGALWTLVLMLIVSLLISRILVKRYVVKPFQFNYLPYTLIITFLIFTLLMYL